MAQRRLAEEMTRSIHDQAALDQAQRISAALFSGDIKQLKADEVEQAFKDVPNHDTGKEPSSLIDLLVDASISSSKRQAREDVKNGAIYINGERVQDLDYVVDEADRLGDAFTVIRRGKKKYFLIRFQ